MTVPIIIRETAKTESGFTATVQFDRGAAYEIAVSDPFAEAEEGQLEWYFERWLNFPFTDKVRAAEAAASIRTYGEALFEQVFRRNPDVYYEYRDLRADEISLEISGSPEFHALHWEALHDPNDERPLAVDALVVRKNLKPVSKRARVQPADRLRVLLVTARPAGGRDVSYRTVSRPLVEALETGRVAAQIDMVRPGTFGALVNHLENVRDEHGDGYYHMIHLDMHGALLSHAQYQQLAESQAHNQLVFGDYAQTPVEKYDGLRAFLFFDDPEAGAAGGGDAGGGDPVSAEDLARLLNMRQIPVVVLNACQSGKQVGAAETSLGSRLLAAGAQLVVAMGYSVTVSAARLLMTTLYGQLLAGRPPAVAIRRARLELYNDKRRRVAYKQQIALEDWLLPVIYQNRAPHFDSRAFSGGAISAAPDYERPRTTHGFVGRDIDILQIERHLLHRRNLLLVRGMGGAGKSTLLHHLGWWWQKTRFVEQVFYFGYDAKAYHLPEIVQSIGAQLGLNLSGIAANDRALVLRKLKSKRHLLILDNLESITGEPLAVQNTLPPAARAELRAFLQELVGGNSPVLLGSRSGEAWLRPDPLRDLDVYELPGLDYEAQTELAQAILQGVGAPAYPQNAAHGSDFQRLLKLLGGYPLAMEVVLANLAAATPAQVIERLQAADVNLDNASEAAQKTESILKCIDYSHSNLSQEAQALLLCLAPFTGVINTSWLGQYTTQLQAQPALAHLPYARWETVLGEAVHWGLLQPHEQLNGYLRLQPIFPYFLKTRLQDAARAEVKAAIEAAFRAHYNGIGWALAQAIQSKEAQERQTGQALIGIEFENLMTALHISLDLAEDFYNVYGALDLLYGIQLNHLRCLELGQFVLESEDLYKSEDAFWDDYDKKFMSVVNRVASAQLELQHYRDAEGSYLDFIQRIVSLTDIPDDQKAKGKAGALHQLGGVAQGQRQWTKAERYYQEALQIFVDYDDRYGQAPSLHQLGEVTKAQRQWTEAVGYYQKALQIYIDFNDRYSQAGSMRQLGIVAQAQRQWTEAAEYYQKALQIYIDFNDRYSQAGSLHQLGMVAQEQRQWVEAEEYYRRALQIKISNNDRHSQASTLHNLGVVAQVQRQWAQAESYFKDALQIYIDFNDHHKQAGTLHNLGWVAQAHQQWTQAEDYFKEALQIYIDYNDRYEQAGTLHHLGIVAQAQRQWAQAESYFKDALQIQIDFNDRYSQGATYRQLGNLAQDQRDWSSAKVYYQEVLEIYVEFNDRFEQAKAFHDIGIMAQEQRQWAEAAQYGLEAAEIYVQYQDQQNLGIALRTLGRVWRGGHGAEIPQRVAALLGVTVAEVEALLGGTDGE